MSLYLITPLGKPRQTQRDKWAVRPEVARYRAFADEVRLRKVDLRPSGAKITFYLPMPKSWSKKRRDEMRGKPHQQKPDLDNCIKALADAVHGDDAHLWHYEARKLWGEVGAIEIVYPQRSGWEVEEF